MCQPTIRLFDEKDIKVSKLYEDEYVVGRMKIFPTEFQKEIENKIQDLFPFMKFYNGNFSIVFQNSLECMLKDNISLFQAMIQKHNLKKIEFLFSSVCCNSFFYNFHRVQIMENDFSFLGSQINLEYFFVDLLEECVCDIEFEYPTDVSFNSRFNDYLFFEFSDILEYNNTYQMVFLDFLETGNFLVLEQFFNKNTLEQCLYECWNSNRFLDSFCTLDVDYNPKYYTPYYDYTYY